MNRFGWGFLLLLLLAVGAFVLMLGGESGEEAADEAPVVIPVPKPLDPPAVTPSGLAIPVSGVSIADLYDSFDDPRSSDRDHQAIDIMAPRGTPVIAAMPGTVEKLFLSDAGGTTAYVRSDDGRWIAYYAHLDAYAAGLAEGKRLKRGDPIGTVGDSGNAAGGSPHVHVEVWPHGGEPLDPKPILDAYAAEALARAPAFVLTNRMVLRRSGPS